MAVVNIEYPTNQDLAIERKLRDLVDHHHGTFITRAYDKGRGLDFDRIEFHAPEDMEEFLIEVGRLINNIVVVR